VIEIPVLRIILLYEKHFGIKWGHVWSRDSSVGIATGYGLDDEGEREFESR
jgi:hypothetical protein